MVGGDNASGKPNKRANVYSSQSNQKQNHTGNNKITFFAPFSSFNFPAFTKQSYNKYEFHKYR